MRNYVQPGDSLALAVPCAGGVTSGQGFLVGALFGVAAVDGVQTRRHSAIGYLSPVQFERLASSGQNRCPSNRQQARSTHSDVRSQALMAQSSHRHGGMRYGPGSLRLRPHDSGGPSRDPASSSEPE